MKVLIKKYTVVIIIAISLTLILAGGRYILYDRSAKIIGDILFEVAQLTDNKYDFTNSDISYFPFERQLLIKDLAINPAADSESETKYKVVIPELFIDVESLFEVYFEKSLSVTGIRLVKPAINVFSNGVETDSDQENVSRETRDLYSLINQYLDKLRIKSLDIKEGAISFKRGSTSILNIKKFDIHIGKFSMDSANLVNRENIFYTESVSLHLSKERFRLQKSDHLISFDSLVFSSKDSTFLVENLKFFREHRHDNEDSLGIANIQFSGVDLNALFEEKMIDLGKIYLQEPYIHLKTSGGGGMSGSFVNNYVYGIRFDSLHLQNGSFSINSPQQLITADDITLRHGAYLIDPGHNVFNYNELLARILLQTRRFTLNRSDVTIAADTLSLDGYRNELELGQFRSVANTPNTMVDTYASKLRLRNLQSPKEGQLVVDSLWIEQPSILVKANASKQIKKEKNGSLKAFGINYLNLSNGILTQQLTNGVIETRGLSIVGNRIRDSLGIANARRVQVLASSTITLDSAVYQIGDWSYDGKRNKLKAFDIVTPFGPIKELRINKPNLLSLSNKGKPTFDSINVVGADLQLSLPQDQSNDTGLPIVFNYASISKSDLQLCAGKGEYKAKNLNAGISKDLILEQFLLDSLNGALGDMNFNAEKVYLSQNENKFISECPEVVTKNVQFHSDSISVAFNGPLKVDDLGEIDKSLKKIVLNRPNVFITNQKSTSDDPKEIMLPPFEVRDGQFVVDNQDGTHYSVAEADLNFTEGISLKNLNDLNKGDIALSHIILTTKSGYVKLDRAFLSEQKVLLQSVGLHNNGGPRVSLGLIKLVNADLEQLKQKQLTADTVAIRGMSLNWVLTGGKSNSEGIKLPIGVDVKTLLTKQMDLKLIFPDQKLDVFGLGIDLDGLSLPKDVDISDRLKDLGFKISGSSMAYTNEKIHRFFNTSDFSIDNRNGDIVFKNLSTEPLLDKKSYMLTQDHQTDWIDVETAEVAVRDFKLKDFLNTKGINARKVELTNPKLNIYRDKTLPEPTAYQSMLYTKLRKAPFLIDVDSLIVKDCEIHIEQQFVDVPELGVMSFRKLNGQVYNIKNNPTNPFENLPALVIKANGEILEGTPFSANVVFQSLDTASNFIMSGSVGGGSLLSLNTMLEKAGHLRVNSGEIKMMEFSMTGNNDYALGEMRFMYDDLNINILNKENENEGFKSFFANTFVIHNKNPHFLFTRKGDIYFERKKNKEIFNFWANAILSGAVSSIGAGNNKKEIRKVNQTKIKQFKLQEKEQKHQKQITAHQ